MVQSNFLATDCHALVAELRSPPVSVSLVSRPSLSSPFSSPCYVDFNCSICFASLVSRERAASLSRHALHTESCAKNDSFGHRPDAQRLLPAERAENLVYRRLTATVNIPQMTLQIVQENGRNRPFFILFSRISDVIIFCYYNWQSCDSDLKTLPFASVAHAHAHFVLQNHAYYAKRSATLT